MSAMTFIFIILNQAFMLVIFLFTRTATSTRFSFQKPSDETIQQYLESQLQDFNHHFQNITSLRQSVKPQDVGFKTVLHYSGKIGESVQDYNRAKNIILNWAVHDGSNWADIQVLKCTGKNKDAPRNLATVAQCYGGFLWAMNPCRIVYEDVDQRFPRQTHEISSWWPCKKRGEMFTAVSYGTLQGHLIAGEERIQVTLDQAGSRKDKAIVYLDIYSVSRGSGIFGTLAFPIMRNMQKRFFREQLQTLGRSLQSTIQ